MLPLDSWRDIIGYHPWHFWQMSDSTYTPVSSKCNTLIREYSWLDADEAGRDDIRKAITEAHARLREHLNYSIGRNFVVETLQYPRPRGYGQQFAGSVGGDSRWLSLQASEGYIRALGVETYTEIESDAEPIYADQDGDGLEESFAITLTGLSSTITDANKIEVHFQADDRFDDDPISEKTRILPVKVTLDTDAGTAVITGRKWLMVKPILYQGLTQVGTTSGGRIDPTVDSNFVTRVDVYYHTTDPTGTTTSDSQAVLVWETAPYPFWATCCSNSSTLSYTPNSQDPAGYAYAIARAQVRDARNGIVTVGEAVYDSDAGEFKGVSWGAVRQPDRVILRYEAGIQLQSVEPTSTLPRVDARWDTIVARLAAAELSRRPCACDVANREYYKWQVDYALQETPNAPENALSNPLGTRGGHVYAWNQIMDQLNLRAFLPG